VLKELKDRKVQQVQKVLKVPLEFKGFKELKVP
jgi:hypothetical protein